MFCLYTGRSSSILLCLLPSFSVLRTIFIPPIFCPVVKLFRPFPVPLLISLSITVRYKLPPLCPSRFFLFSNILSNSLSTPISCTLYSPFSPIATFLMHEACHPYSVHVSDPYIEQHINLQILCYYNAFFFYYSSQDSLVMSCILKFHCHFQHIMLHLLQYEILEITFYRLNSIEESLCYFV